MLYAVLMMYSNLGRADWLYDPPDPDIGNIHGFHIPCCSYVTVEHRACHNGPLTDNEITIGRCSLHTQSPTLPRPPKPYFYPVTYHFLELLDKYELDWSELDLIRAIPRNGVVRWFVNCSDTFAWATADAQEITLDNLGIMASLFDSYLDFHSPDDYVELDDVLILWVSIVRNTRPMDLYLQKCSPWLTEQLDERKITETEEPWIVPINTPTSNGDNHV
jgi:hypothetical protein